MEIAVGALSDMVDALPGMLGELLKQEYDLLSGVRDDVEFLQLELGTMHAALLRCESVDDPDVQTRTWVGMVRELAYDIEDWVDLFAHRVDAGSHDTTGGTSFRIFRWCRRGIDKITTIRARHVIATEMQDLKARVLELSQQRKRYRFEAPAGPAGARCAAGFDPRLTALYADTTSLVGLDAPMEEVAKMVMNAGKAELKVVSIVGMAGSGKTTLAAAVHRLLEKQNSFDCGAFVSLGQKPDIAGKTLKGILSQIGDGYGVSDDIGQLIGRLREKLEDKRYLVVIDDIWSRTEWSRIKCCFPDKNLGSRILITTRNGALAKDCSSRSSEGIYKIGLLSDTNSRDLFIKKAFGNTDACPPHLEDVSSQIIRRCGGLPLAIASVAGVLAHHQPSKDEWQRFGSNLLSSSHLDRLKQIFNLSYSDLPPHLKTCLLYLSIFPENYKIAIERLVRRWIAEGIISEPRRESREETARCYLNDLITRNMVQELHLKHDGTPRSCTVHPVIHDFIVVKSMEENFVTLVDVQKKDVSTNHGTVRRLSLQNSSEQDKAVAQNDAMKHARSLTVFGHASGAPRLTYLSVLRVLDLEGCAGSICLDGLCKLVLLRYLSLRGTDVSELPAQVGDLRCLETLDVRSTNVKELPPSIVRLEKLMHLLIGNAKLPCGIEKMKALLTLSCADVGKSSGSVMQEISEIGNLRELELFCDVTQMSGDKKHVAFPSNGFRSLKQLCIHCSLPSVTFETGALPKVEALELKFEKGLSDESSGVSGIEHLLSLKHVFVEFSQHDVGQHDVGVAATVAAVRTAAETVHPNRPDVTVKVDGKNN